MGDAFTVTSSDVMACKITGLNPIKYVWSMLRRRIAGRSVPPGTLHVDIYYYRNGWYCHKQAINDTTASLLRCYQACISGRGYPKKCFEKQSIDFKSPNTEPYNQDFIVLEVKRALSQTKSSCPGPDGIAYPMLKHLRSKSLAAILFIFNRVWNEQVFPNAWRTASVIPNTEPGKDPTNPSSYRPIALTSCLCKLFEKMVNTRGLLFGDK
ncbi:putative RNA-directed DNA polymerase from transposon X-element, partial [Stegodyphus mimosarum]